MTDKVRKILEEVSANEDWKKELEERLKSVENAAKNAALLAFVEEKGYEIAEEDLTMDAQELSAEELEQVSGGDGCGCVAWGQGLGLNTEDGGLDCHCYFAGTGCMPGTWGEVTSQGGCVCVVGGAGASNRH